MRGERKFNGSEYSFRHEMLSFTYNFISGGKNVAFRPISRIAILKSK